MSVSLRHDGLPEGVSRFDLLSALKAVAVTELKLNGREVHYLELAIRRCSDADFRKGSICAHWVRVANIAAELGCTPRQVNTIEKSLEARKLILRTTGINGRRHGCRDNGDINYASGTNLAPMIERYDEFVDLSRDCKLRDLAMAAARSQIQWCRRQIREFQDASYIARADQIIPRGCTSVINDLERLEAIQAALMAVLDEISFDPSRAETSDARAVNSDQSELGFRPTIQNQDSQNNRMPFAQKSAKPVTQQQLLLLASRHYQELITILGGPSSTNFVEASRLVCIEHGIPLDLWGNACQQLGRERAALCMLVIDRNLQLPETHRFHRHSACGSLRGMLRKGGGNLNLNGMLRAMQGYQQGDGSNRRATPRNTVEHLKPDYRQIGSLLSNIVGNFGLSNGGNRP